MTKLAKLGLLVGAIILGTACGGGSKQDTLPPGGGTGGATGTGTAGNDNGATNGTGNAADSGAKAIYQPALLATPLPNDPTKTTIHRLSNGMTVYISPDAQQPTVVAHIAVRAGGAEDPQRSTGLAHYLEHMLFKGTTKLGTLDYAKEKPHLDKIASLYADLRKPGSNRAQVLTAIDKENLAAAQYEVPNELDQLYSRMGVTGLNAFTNNDATVYVSEVPKNRIAQWAHVEAQRYSDAVFRLFLPELEAVYEEKNRGMDSPPRRVNEAFMKALYPNHGYGWSSVLGEIEHLKSPAYQDMLDFFHRYYNPQNMAILLAGDVDTSVLPVLEKEFGRFHREPGPAEQPGTQTPLSGVKTIEVKVPSQEGVVLGWLLVPATHPDRLPLELMDLLLLDGQSGILARDLLLTQKVADAGCNPTFLRDGGYYEMYADALKGQSLDQLQKLLLGLVAKLQNGDFTDQDVATAILTYEIQQQQILESNRGRMSLLQESFIDGEKWSDTISKIDRMKKITKADIMRVAKQYLNGNMLVVKKVIGKPKTEKIEKPHITPVEVDPKRQSAFAKEVMAMKVSPIEPVSLVEGKDYARGKIKTGEFVAVKNTRNKLFSVSFDYDYGRFDDRMACAALDILKVSGAGKRDAQQVARHLHELGLSIDASCSADQSSISISGIDRNLEQGMALLREWLASPNIGNDTLASYIKTTLTNRENAMSTPNVISAALQQYARVGNNSEFLMVPTDKALQRVKPAQLQRVLARFLDMKHRTAYFGPRDEKTAESVVVLGKGSIRARRPRPDRFRAPNHVFATDQDTKQMQILMSWPRRPANNNDRAVGTLFSEYIGPVLYQEVREARGLAYTVAGWYSPGGKKIDDASVGAYVGTQADKIHDSINAVLDTMHKPIDDKRLDNARETIMQNHRVDRIRPRAIANTVYAWEDQGEKADPRDARVKRALAVKKPDLEKWIKTALARRVLVSVSGPKKVIDLKKLSKIAPVTWVPKKKLFGY